MVLYWSGLKLAHPNHLAFHSSKELSQGGQFSHPCDTEGRLGSRNHILQFRRRQTSSGTALHVACMKMAWDPAPVAFSSAVVHTDVVHWEIWNGNTIAGIDITMVYYCRQLDLPYECNLFPKSRYS
jgi:hypothetical protein